MESDLDLESGGGISGSAEVAREASEKQKESSKKAQAQLQKTQKDEKKAHQDNALLFQVLSRFLQNPYYESLVPSVVWLLEADFPSREVVILPALVYPEATLFVLETLGQRERIHQMTHLFRYEILTTFDESTLHESLRTWISAWMDFSLQFLTRDGDASIVLAQKSVDLLRSGKRTLYLQALRSFFSFFFLSRNLDITPDKTTAYTDFMVHEFEQSLLRFLDGKDVDLREAPRYDMSSLFGVSPDL